jgi:hypothetical protein
LVILITQLYQFYFREARIFPSKNRDKVVLEIMNTFRVNRRETDSDKLRIQLLLATQGLDQLKAYTCLKDQKGNLEVTMHQNPMPMPASRRPIKALKIDELLGK